MVITVISWVLLANLQANKFYKTLSAILAVFCLTIFIGAITSLLFYFITGQPQSIDRWFINGKSADTSKVSVKEPDTTIPQGNNPKIKEEEQIRFNSQEKEFSIQLDEDKGGYKKIFVDNTLIVPLANSTPNNPRILVRLTNKPMSAYIITQTEDSCFFSLSLADSSYSGRIIPNCNK